MKEWFWELDYLSQESNRRITPPKVFEERELNEEDIPRLLEIILELQTKRPRKTKPSSEMLRAAEILVMKRVG